MAEATYQLPAPDVEDQWRGQYSLSRYTRVEVTAGLNKTWNVVDNIQSIEVGDPTYKFNTDLFAQGSRNSTNRKREPMWPVTIVVHNSAAAQIMSDLTGAGWGSTQYALPMQPNNDLSQVHWCTSFRESDNTTVHLHLLIQDLIIDGAPLTNSMDGDFVTITGHTYMPPAWIYSTKKPYYDVYSGLGAGTGAYTLSATPATVVVSANYIDWIDDKTFSVKVKDASAGDTILNQRTTGWTVSGKTLTITTDLPVSADVLAVLYLG